MPFISKAEFEKLLDIIDIEEYRNEILEHCADYEAEIKEKCDLYVDEIREKCDTYKNEVKEQCDALVEAEVQKRYEAHKAEAMQECEAHKAETIKECEELIAKAEVTSKNILELSNLQALNFTKMNEATCEKYRNIVKAECNREKRLIHEESKRIFAEAYQNRLVADLDSSALVSQKDDLQEEILSLKEEIYSLQEKLGSTRCNIEEEQGAVDIYVREQLHIVDHMYDGLEFEDYFASLLEDCGYTKVTVTRGSGDSGVDVLAEYLGIPFAFQCKRYNQQVGNKAVQEVFSGMSVYDCSVGVVITNNTFTKGAVSQANFNHILLWGREELSNLIVESYKKQGAKGEEKETARERVTVRLNGKQIF